MTCLRFPSQRRSGAYPHETPFFVWRTRQESCALLGATPKESLRASSAGLFLGTPGGLRVHAAILLGIFCPCCVRPAAATDLCRGSGAPISISSQRVSPSSPRGNSQGVSWREEGAMRDCNAPAHIETTASTSLPSCESSCRSSFEERTAIVRQ